VFHSAARRDGEPTGGGFIKGARATSGDTQLKFPAGLLPIGF